MKNLILLFLLLCSFAYAQVAKVVALNGEANIQRGEKSIALSLDSLIEENDVINTSDNTKLQIIFSDETIITIGKNSTFAVNDFIFDEKQSEYKAEFSLLKGTFRTITGKIGKIAPDKFKLKSKSSSIGIRGTQILSQVEISGDTIFCTEGRIVITSAFTGQTIQLQAGEYIQINEDAPLVIKKFDVNVIKEADTNTKFLNEEEKEGALEQFGVTLSESETQNEPDTPTENNSESVNSGVSSTVNNTSVQENTTDSIASSLSLNGRANILTSNGTRSATAYGYGDFTNTSAKFEYAEGEPITLIFNNIKENYVKDGSYSGTLSVNGQKYFNSLGNFQSGTYSSKSDSTSGFNTNDNVQWGNWNVTLDDGSVEGFWIVGEQTSTSEIQSLINNAVSATYKGFTLGKYTTDAGSTYSALNSSNSSFTLNFNFGTNSITPISGNFTLPGAGSLSVSNGSITTSSFGFKIGTVTDNNASGKFYGSNASSIGGEFTAKETINGTTYNYTGVFKGSK